MAWIVLQGEHGFDVAPAITIDGEQMRSGSHAMSSDCHCIPRCEMRMDGIPIWIHNDPDADEVAVRQ